MSKAVHNFQMTAKHPVFRGVADRQLGIGVVGLNEGQTLLTGLNRAPHTRAVAGCDLSEERLAETRAAHPNLFLTTEYDELLSRPEVDIVVIYTPDQLHGVQVTQAMEAGKDVICTKPLVNTVEDARLVLTTGRATGRRLQVGQSCRFFESFTRQRRAWERGEIGSVELADAHYTHRMDWYYDKSEWVIGSTDWVFLGLSHPIDLVRWYLGPIDEVSAVASRSALATKYGLPGHDIYLVNLRARDGRIGRAMGHYGLHELPSARNAIELVLYGSTGTSMAQYHDMRYATTREDGTEVWEDALYANRAYYFNNEVHGMHYGEFANYTEYFAKAIMNDEPNAPDLEEGIDTFCIMEAVRRSSREGVPMRVDDVRAEVGL